MQRNLVIQDLNRITAERYCTAAGIECQAQNNRFGWSMTLLFYENERCGLITPASTNLPVTISINIDMISKQVFLALVEQTGATLSIADKRTSHG